MPVFRHVIGEREHLKMRNFSIQRLDRLFKRFPNAFWRHDVDVCIDSALEMAEFEASRGIRATFYLFLSQESPFYSILDALKAERKLYEMGHRIGLHVDERKISKWDWWLDMRPRGPISFHCPTEHVLWRDFPTFENAYAARWKGRYVADSMGVFRYGDPEDVAEDGWQINLHPEWWFNPTWETQVDAKTYEEFFYIPKPAASSYS